MAVNRLRSKESGVGFCLAVLQQLLYFWFVPQIIERYWPSFLELSDYLNLGLYNCMIIVVILLQFWTLITANLGFFFCYKVNLPFFEKYKSVEEPWPWQSDP